MRVEGAIIVQFFPAVTNDFLFLPSFPLTVPHVVSLTFHTRGSEGMRGWKDIMDHHLHSLHTGTSGRGVVNKSLSPTFTLHLHAR